MPAIIDMLDEALREQATKLGRESLEAHLLRFSPEQRDAFWNAIGLYYSSRRYPGADESAEEAALPDL